MSSADHGVAHPKRYPEGWRQLQGILNDYNSDTRNNCDCIGNVTKDFTDGEQQPEIESDALTVTQQLEPIRTSQ